MPLQTSADAAAVNYRSDVVEKDINDAFSEASYFLTSFVQDPNTGYETKLWQTVTAAGALRAIKAASCTTAGQDAILSGAQPNLAGALAALNNSGNPAALGAPATPATSNDPRLDRFEALARKAGMSLDDFLDDLEAVGGSYVDIVDKPSRLSPSIRRTATKNLFANMASGRVGLEDDLSLTAEKELSTARNDLQSYRGYKDVKDAVDTLPPGDQRGMRKALLDLATNPDKADLSTGKVQTAPSVYKVNGISRVDALLERKPNDFQDAFLLLSENVLTGSEPLIVGGPNHGLPNRVVSLFQERDARQQERDQARQALTEVNKNLEHHSGVFGVGEHWELDVDGLSDETIGYLPKLTP